MPKKGYKYSEEAKRKRSVNHKGFLGKHCSKEHKRKISESETGKIVSEETKKKQSEAKKGIKFSKGHKRKISESHKGKPSNRLGKHCSEEHKQKLREANSGDKGSNWQGGISYQPYLVDWTDDLREAIRKRDNYICQLCGIHQNELEGWNKKLDVHHIDYNKDNLNPTNLITLCRNCHIKTNYNREYWEDYFNGRRW